MTQRGTGQFALTAEDIADPYPVYRHYREVDPVHVVPAASPDLPSTWYLFRYADVVRVLSSPHVGRSAQRACAHLADPPALIPAHYPVLREVVSGWLVFLDPPRHTRLRALVATQFSPRVVTGLRVRVDRYAHELLLSMREKEHTDLVEDYSAPLPILVISELLGIPRERRAWMRDRAVALQEANSSRTDGRPDRYATAEAAARDLRDYFLDEIRLRRRREYDDLTALLVRDHDGDGSLTDAEIVSTCIHLLTAGHETTTNLVSKATLALLAHPGTRDELRTDPQLMPGAVDELIRYDPPVQMITRWAYRDLVIAGRTISRGSRIVLVLGSANRDPERFAEPDTLDIRRNASRHCGFGMGIHYCLGAPLARLEAEVALVALLRELPHLATTGETVRYADDLVFHGPSRLLLRTGKPPGPNGTPDGHVPASGPSVPANRADRPFRGVTASAAAAPSIEPDVERHGRVDPL
nr:cytochrome P450 [uncultured bacterium]